MISIGTLAIIIISLLLPLPSPLAVRPKIFIGVNNWLFQVSWGDNNLDLGKTRIQP